MPAGANPDSVEDDRKEKVAKNYRPAKKMAMKKICFPFQIFFAEFVDFLRFYE